MRRLRAAKPQEVQRILRKLGFQLVRQSGSHAVYRIGTTTTGETLEQLSEGHKRLDLAQAQPDAAYEATTDLVQARLGKAKSV